MVESYGILSFFKIIKDIIDKTIKRSGKCISYIKNTAAISLSVQIVISPVMMYFYKTISFTFLIANILSRFPNKHNYNLWFCNIYYFFLAN
ncbi:MAG: ComEC/Rec2 family competence protein [Clostridia bacterium]|nr:ComEC/Rec2 family competence protein [Clostridia bacterium]